MRQTPARLGGASDRMIPVRRTLPWMSPYYRWQSLSERSMRQTESAAGFSGSLLNTCSSCLHPTHIPIISPANIIVTSGTY